MMGDAGGASETYRGMLALDEYGTRRIKQWMHTSIEPALKQLGNMVLSFCQATYSANKRFRLVQPSAIQEGRTSEINIPIYTIIITKIRIPCLPFSWKKSLINLLILVSGIFVFEL